MRKIAFDENIAMDMLIDHTDNGMSFSKLAKKYGMSMSTAYRHVEKIKEMLDEKDSENTEIQPKDIEEDKNKPVIEIIKSDEENINEGIKMFSSKDRDILTCGLVADRHSMPSELFIFDNIDSDLMFDYYMQESIVRDFIKQHINFDDHGNPDKDIVLYLSGLQCALESVFLVCDELHINLTTAHYNTQTGKYRFRNTISKYPLPSYNAKINTLRITNDTVYEYNCNINDLVHGDEFYIITQVDLDNDFTIKKRNIIIITDYNLIWPLYGELIKKRDELNIKRNIYVNTQKITPNGYIKINTLSASQIPD